MIAWLLLQIADVTFEPLGVPRWVMITLITAAVLGFPVAIALAWHFELGDRGLARDTAADAAARPVVHGLRRYADVAIIGVLLATVAALLVRQSDLAKPPPPDRPTIAVLPFANLSGDPAQEYFSDGLAQELLDRLGRVPGLAVIGRSSSFSFKGKALDARTIAGRLGATTILEGAVRRTGQQLRVSATLVDGDTGRTIWSQSYDRAMTDVFAVQEEVAAAVIEAIVPAARGDATNAVTPPPTRDTAAYDLYLLGRAAQEARTPDRMRESVAYFERALQLDPAYAKAYAGLSRSLMLWQNYGGGGVPPPPDAQKRAEAAAYRALAIDPELSEGHAALGTALREHDPARAEELYKRALELNPNNVTALWDYNTTLNDAGRPADQAALMARVRKLDPRLAIAWTSVIGNLIMMERFRSSEPSTRRRWSPWPTIQTGSISSRESARILAGRQKPIAQRSPSSRPGTWTSHCCRGPSRLTCRSRTTRVLARWLELARRRDSARSSPAYSINLAGASSDWLAVDAIARDIAALGLTDPVSLGPIAFWLAVQERYAEAAAVYARIGPLPEAVGCSRASAEIRVCPHCCEPTVPPAVRTRRRSSPLGISPHYAALRSKKRVNLTGTRSTWPRSRRTKATRTKPWQHCAPRSSSRTWSGASIRSCRGFAAWRATPATRRCWPSGSAGSIRRAPRCAQIEAQFPDSVIVKTVRAAGR